jgi:hypothetical protein
MTREYQLAGLAHDRALTSDEEDTLHRYANDIRLAYIFLANAEDDASEDLRTIELSAALNAFQDYAESIGQNLDWADWVDWPRGQAVADDGG